MAIGGSVYRRAALGRFLFVSCVLLDPAGAASALDHLPEGALSTTELRPSAVVSPQSVASQCAEGRTRGMAACIEPLPIGRWDPSSCCRCSFAEFR